MQGLISLFFLHIQPSPMSFLFIFMLEGTQMHLLYSHQTERQDHHGIIIPDNLVQTRLVFPPVLCLHHTRPRG